MNFKFGKSSSLSFLVIILAFTHFAHGKVKENEIHEQAKSWMQEHPVRFLENKGQMKDMAGQPVPSVLFKAEAPGLNLYITEKGLTYTFLKFEEENEKKDESQAGWDRRKETKIKWARVDVELKGGEIKRENIFTEGASAGFLQYFFSHCSEGITNVHSYDKVTIRNVYPGIDWIFYNSTEKGFKYDFVVHPGADPALIKMIYLSENELNINGEGGTTVKTALGTVTENAPFSYFQDTKVEIASSFVKKLLQSPGGPAEGYETEISFLLDAKSKDRRSAFVIDPQLVWATFYGGSSYADGPMAIAADNSRNVLVTGYTGSTDFPVQTAGGNFFQGTHGGGNPGAPWDAFVLKFNAAGVLQWATYYGGDLYDEAHAIVADAAGNIFVTGLTESSTFPVQNSGTFFQGANGGGYDAFILKFDGAGNRLWATYYGGSSSNNADTGNGIDVDANGNVFVAGTASPNFPLQNAGTFFQGAAGGGFGGDAFILKFDNAGNRLWATYYGGNGNDKANSLVVDPSGNVFVAGMTTAVNFPTLNAGTFFQAANAGGGYDAYILKFDNAGNRLWATYYGGSGDDEFWAVATDGSGNLFTSGSTTSTNFPVQNAGTFFQGTFAGGWLDAVIVKFDNAGNRLWGSYYGGTLNELIETPGNLAVDSCGSVYMGFYTDPSNTLSPLAPCDGGYFDNSFNGGQYDDYIVQFSNSGTLLWATYLGGNGYDFRASLAVDNAGSLLVTGEWSNLFASGINSSTYPLTNPGGGATYNSYSGGSDDGFVVKFNKIPLVLTPSSVNAACGCDGSASVAPTGGCVPYTYSWSNGQTTQAVSNLCAGTYTVTVADAACSIKTTTVMITAGAGAITTTATVTAATCGVSNGSSTVTPAGGSSPYTYAWSPSGGTNASATGLASGNYSVVITDGVGCSVTTTVNITSAGGFTTTVTSASAICLAANGSATVTPSGGTSPYTYAWSPSGGNSSAATGLSAGSYTVIVTDGSGCAETASVTVTSSASGITTTASSTPSCLSANGSATVTPGGGASPYTYAWSPGGGNSSVATGLSVGNYSVLITDANGCTGTAAVSISSASGPTLLVSSQTSVSCNGGSNASASVQASGGTIPYSYSWSSGQSTVSASNLSAGNYTVTVTDASGCTQTQTLSITQPTAITATASTTPASCGNSDGTATATGSGGTPGYSYTWSNSQTTSAISNLAPGNYTVTITDANGCTQTATAGVLQAGGPAATAGTNVTILQGNSTTLTSSAPGAATYSWTPTSGLSCTNCSSPTASPTQTTEYCVYIFDTAGCYDSACVTVYVTTEPTDCSKARTGDMYLPTAFSPNEDGQNDKITLLYGYKECIETFEISIYNRWGEEVFRSEDPYFIWNGTYLDKLENTAVFAYVLKATLTSSEEISKKGNISLLR